MHASEDTKEQGACSKLLNEKECIGVSSVSLRGGRGQTNCAWPRGKELRGEQEGGPEFLGS